MTLDTAPRGCSRDESNRKFEQVPPGHLLRRGGAFTELARAQFLVADDITGDVELLVVMTRIPQEPAIWDELL